MAAYKPAKTMKEQTVTAHHAHVHTAGSTVDAVVDDYHVMMPDLDATDAGIMVGLWRLLADGSPVTRGGLADTLGVARDRVAATLDGPLAGSYLVDGNDRIRGFWGLSLPEEPTPHRLLLDDRTLYAWCAADALFLPLLLGRTLEVRSTLTGTEQSLTLVVHPDRLGVASTPDAAVSLVPRAPEGLGDSPAAMMSTYCHHILFFPDQAAGRRWAEQQGRDDLVLASLTEAFAAYQRLFRSLLGAALDGG